MFLCVVLYSNLCCVIAAYLSSAAGADCFTSSPLGVSTLAGRAANDSRTTLDSASSSDRQQRSNTPSPAAQSDPDRGAETTADGRTTPGDAAGSTGSAQTTAAAVRPEKPLHPKLLGVGAQLEMKSLWDEFDSLGTEMIVTKAGRYPIDILCPVTHAVDEMYDVMHCRAAEIAQT